MNRIFTLLLCTLALSCSTTRYSAIPPDQPNTPGYRIKYDHKALRIPGDKFAIGLTIPTDEKTQPHTIGYSGDGGFGKYHVEVDSGSFSGSNVKLHDSKVYKKGDSITVNVYKRKWFLGGRGAFLTSRKIPYSYEDSIVLLSDNNSNRFPGGHIKFGIRTFYNNHQTTDLWYPIKKKNQDDYLLEFDGGHLSKSKGDLKIDPDPTHIQNDAIWLLAHLAKNPAIGDTLRLLLDYKAAYRCNVTSSDLGHDLNINVDVFDDEFIHQKLMSIEVHDNTTGRIYRYMINTAGGSLKVSTTSGSGASGDNGQPGYNGNDGADGVVENVPMQVRDTKGNDSTIYVQRQGPGGNGEDGGQGGDGENGYNGYDGGNITITYTPAAEPFLNMILAQTFAGIGGSGGFGGPGGNGGAGGNGNPPGSNGRQGPSGNNGVNGSPGRPGEVRFVAL
ncbi:MAG: hypothetical protein JST68_30230 [Bacteroidetes bacterium]|nr:hypothetical protein [Bacteroidota bacterium]